MKRAVEIGAAIIVTLGLASSGIVVCTCGEDHACHSTGIEAQPSMSGCCAHESEKAALRPAGCCDAQNTEMPASTGEAGPRLAQHVQAASLVVLPNREHHLPSPAGHWVWAPPNVPSLILRI